MANRARSLTDQAGPRITLVDPRTQATKTIETPKGAAISSPTWSPNGAQIAYIANYHGRRTCTWPTSRRGKSVQVTRTPLLATFVTTIDWTADGKCIVAVLVPDARGASADARRERRRGWPAGAAHRVARRFRRSMHASLLEDPHDKALLKYYTTGQLAADRREVEGGDGRSARRR